MLNHFGYKIGRTSNRKSALISCLKSFTSLTVQTTTAEMTSHNDIEFIPGTELMGEDGIANKALIPTPSSDPQDPLNWPQGWKRKSIYSDHMVCY